MRDPTVNGTSLARDPSGCSIGLGGTGRSRTPWFRDGWQVCTCTYTCGRRAMPCHCPCMSHVATRRMKRFHLVSTSSIYHLLYRRRYCIGLAFFCTTRAAGQGKNTILRTPSPLKRADFDPSLTGGVGVSPSRIRQFCETANRQGRVFCKRCAQNSI